MTMFMAPFAPLMHLLVISTWFPFPPTNGAKLRAYHLLKGLATAHRIHLLTFAERDERTEVGLDQLASFCESVDVVVGNPAKAPARLGLTGLISSTPRAYRQGFDPDMQALVNRHAKQCQAALALELPASLYLRALTLPRVLEEAEVTAVAQKMLEAKGLRRLRHALTVKKLGYFMRRLSQELDHVTVVSETERQALIQMGCGPSRLSVVPNGADPSDLERPLGTPVRTTVVYPGAPTYGPNLDAVRWFLTEAWPNVRTAHPDAQFLVTGSTGGVDLGALPQSPGVQFLGFVDDVKAVISSCGACVVPLRLGGGTRLKVLEALALGVPVVATAKAVEGIDVVPDVHVLIGNTAAELAVQLGRIFNDPALANRLRAAGRTLVQTRYTWPRIAATLSDRLEQLAS